MCGLAFIVSFVLAHIVAWNVLGGGWSGAARAPFAVMIPAVALLLLDAVLFDNYVGLGMRLMVLVSWEALYFFLYICLRIITRPSSAPPVES
jgi:hypothetical protein